MSSNTSAELTPEQEIEKRAREIVDKLSINRIEEIKKKGYGFYAVMELKENKDYYYPSSLVLRFLCSFLELFALHSLRVANIISTLSLIRITGLAQKVFEELEVFEEFKQRGLRPQVKLLEYVNHAAVDPLEFRWFLGVRLL